MLIGGLQKISLIDYPEKVAATVFTLGCNFSCPFCHNADLVEPEQIKKHPLISEKYFFKFLKGKQGLLDGVCVTGGEPTAQKDLEEFIAKIKALGFLVKLDTNGSRPQILRDLLKKNLVDYIAMDIKAPLQKYPKVVRKDVRLGDIHESVSLGKEAPDYEFRTTVVPGLIEKDDILAIAQWLKGSRRYFLQQFVPEKTVDSAFEKVDPYHIEKLRDFCQLARPYFKKCDVRV